MSFSEAETNCVASRNFGHIATFGVNNLSFFSRWSAEVVQGEINNSPDIIGKVENSLHNVYSNASNTSSVSYDMSKVYVALVIGDGDNVFFMKGHRTDWMKERQNHCDVSLTIEKKKRCFPLSWTISSHLAKIAPDVLRWYIAQASSLEIDTFLLPPSGHLYSYPGMMPDDVHDNFIKETEQDALLLNTTGVVDWEWFTDWKNTEANFYPKYATRGIIRGIFPINVPYLFPTGIFLPAMFFKVIKPPVGYEGKPVVVFKPREWRGTPREQTNCGEQSTVVTLKECLSSAQLAEEIGSYPKGTVAYIYLTTDGGLSFNDIVEMVNLLPDHVELVDTESATAFALLSNNGSSAVPRTFTYIFIGLAVVIVALIAGLLYMCLSKRKTKSLSPLGKSDKGEAIPEILSTVGSSHDEEVEMQLSPKHRH